MFYKYIILFCLLSFFFLFATKLISAYIQKHLKNGKIFSWLFIIFFIIIYVAITIVIVIVPSINQMELSGRRNGIFETNRKILLDTMSKANASFRLNSNYKFQNLNQFIYDEAREHVTYFPFAFIFGSELIYSGQRNYCYSGPDIKDTKSLIINLIRPTNNEFIIYSFTDLGIVKENKNLLFISTINTEFVIKEYYYNIMTKELSLLKETKENG